MTRYPRGNAPRAAPSRRAAGHGACHHGRVGYTEAERFHQLLLANEPLISCGTLIETLRLMQVALGPPGVAAIERLLSDYGIEPEAVDAGQVGVARDGMLAYGKGRGQEPAVLNFGDLFAYALAKRLGLPLLFKGDDAARTDIIPLPLTGG